MTKTNESRTLGAVRSAAASLFLVAGVLRDKGMNSAGDSVEAEADGLLDLYGELTKTGPYAE